MLVNYYSGGLDEADKRFYKTMMKVNDRYDFTPNEPQRESA